MGRLRVLSGAEVCQILADHGFREVRRRGSHIVMRKRSATSTITVAVPDRTELRLGTLQRLSGSQGCPVGCSRWRHETPVLAVWVIRLYPAL